MGQYYEVDNNIGYGRSMLCLQIWPDCNIATVSWYIQSKYTSQFPQESIASLNTEENKRGNVYSSVNYTDLLSYKGFCVSVYLWYILYAVVWKSNGSGSRKPRLTDVGIRCTDQATPSIGKKLALTSPTSGGHSVGIIRLRTNSHEVFIYCWVATILQISKTISNKYCTSWVNKTSVMVCMDVTRILSTWSGGWNRKICLQTYA
jgi:hypothetical protein